MRKVQCHECGRSYDYDVDDFCPRCGAFNQPLRTARISADGTVVRVDGINEKGHAGSFVHQELHEETRERRRYGLDKSVQRIQRPVQSSQQPSASRRNTYERDRTRKGPLNIIVWIIFAVIALNVLSTVFSMYFR